MNPLRRSVLQRGLLLAGAVPVSMSSRASTLWQTASQLFESKDNYMGPVANKVAEFNEDFVVGSMDFSPDGKHLATCPGAMYRMDVHVRDWRGGALVRVLETGALGLGGTVRYSPDGTLLAAGHAAVKVGGEYRVLRIWNARTGTVVRDLQDAQGADSMHGFAFSPNGKVLFRIADHGGTPGEYLIAYRTDTWEKMWGLETMPFIPSRLAVSPDGGFVALAGTDYSHARNDEPGTDAKVLIVNVAERNVHRTIDVFPKGTIIESLSWSPEGRFLALGLLVPDRTFLDRSAIKVFQATTATLVATEQADDSAEVTGLSYSADGRFLAEGYIDGKVRIWDEAHKVLLQEIPVDEHFHTAVALSRDGHMAIGVGQTVSIWEFHR